MVSTKLPHNAGPPPNVVFSVLNDADCRAILGLLDEPRSADWVAEASGRSLTTAYRKLDQLVEAGLVRETVALRAGGNHRSDYQTAVDRVTVTLDDDRELGVDLSSSTP